MANDTTRSDVESDLARGRLRDARNVAQDEDVLQSVYTIEGTGDLPEPGTDIYGRSHTALSYLDDDVLPTMSDGGESAGSAGSSDSPPSEGDDSLSLEEDEEYQEEERGRSPEKNAEEAREADEDRWETWSRSTGRSKRPKVYYVQARSSSVSGAERTHDWLHSLPRDGGSPIPTEPLHIIDTATPVVSIGSLGTSPRLHRHHETFGPDEESADEAERPSETTPLLRRGSEGKSGSRGDGDVSQAGDTKKLSILDRVMFWRSPKVVEESQSDDEEFWLSPSGDEQEFTLDEDLLVTVKGYRKPFWKVALFNLLAIITLGIVPLLCHWFPSLRVRLLFTSCPLRHARFVHIQNNWDQEDIEPVERLEFGGLVEDVFPPDPDTDVEEEEANGNGVIDTGNPDGDTSTEMEAGVSETHVLEQKDEEVTPSMIEHRITDPRSPRRRSSIKSAPPTHPLPYLTSFTYHCYRFAYNPLTQVFHPILHWRDANWESVPHALRGLPDEKIIQRRLKIFGRNIVQPPVVSTLDLLVNEVLNPFYIFQICSIVLWLMDSYYYYAIVIAVISIASVFTTLVETRSNMRRMREMARWIGEVWVWRPVGSTTVGPSATNTVLTKYGSGGVTGHSWVKVTSDQLVPGDVFEIPAPKPPGGPPVMLSEDEDGVDGIGHTAPAPASKDDSVSNSISTPGRIEPADTGILPCDALLLLGECIVNEAMLTGESVPVTKTAVPDSEIHSLDLSRDDPASSTKVQRWFLFGGTRVIRVKGPARQLVQTTALAGIDSPSDTAAPPVLNGNVTKSLPPLPIPPNRGSLALALRTSFNTTKGSLVRSMLFPKPSTFSFFRDSFRFIGVLCCLACVGFMFSLWSFIRHGVHWSVIVRRALDMITVCVPPALPATMSIGTQFALDRLRGLGIFCISPPRINVAGKVDVWVFDKTGTLTEEGLDVLGVRGVDRESVGFVIATDKNDTTSGDESDEEPALRFTRLFRTCADLVASAVRSHHRAVAWETQVLAKARSEGGGVALPAVLPDPSSPVDLSTKSPEAPLPTLLDAMATCHGIKVVDSVPVGDPLDLRMFEFTGWEMEEGGSTYIAGAGAEAARGVRPFPERSRIDHMVPTVVRPPGQKPLDWSKMVSVSGNRMRPRRPSVASLVAPTSAVLQGDLRRSESDAYPFMELGVVRTLEFVSSLRRMSVIVRRLVGHAGSPAGSGDEESTSSLHAFDMEVFCKGAPEALKSICKPESIPQNCESLLKEYTHHGYRVIAVGWKRLQGVNWMRAMRMNRNDIECDLSFLGIIVFENKVKITTPPVIKSLRSARIRQIMCTGDNVLTAVSVSRECGIIGARTRVFVPRFLDEEEDSEDESGESDDTESDESDSVYGGHYRHSRIVWEDLDMDQEDGGSDSAIDREKEVLILNPRTLDPMVLNITGGSDPGSGNPSPLTVESHSSSPHVVTNGLSPARVTRQSSTDISAASSQRRSSVIRSRPLVQKRQKHRFRHRATAHLHARPDDFILAITGDVFEWMVNVAPRSTLKRMLDRGAIYARMSPDQKQILVEKLQEHTPHTVGFCGDGANDCGALKSGDVGVSLSEAEASVAAPFTSKSPDLQCVLQVVREGRAALVTSFSCFKYMAAYSLIQFTSVTLLYSLASNLGDFQFLFIDLFLIVPLAVTMAWTEAASSIHSVAPTASLISAPVLLSMLGQSFIFTMFQMAAFFWVRQQPFYTPPGFDSDTLLIPLEEDDEDDVPIVGFENSVLFLLTCFQYIFAALMFSVGPPYRRSMFNNVPFVLTVCLLFLINAYLVIHPHTSVREFFELEDLPLEAKLFVCVLVVLNLAVSYVAETWIWDLAIRVGSKLRSTTSTNQQKAVR
ncbi:hypothetical protein M427DRAFT_133689 [Gonapodya prolifera JEL478]|uniref:Cation-transporting ATPase n=1 Tax=Gonapodya prolifera (strain JEL478) TaxID=1344416 RepID=A0A139AKF0_GONPJ|nr:hypothetical protein M427DRAFT_133689 [Gonapodya prolifera JEL478]|eukprot:KXS17261.1 hypothetical protein M427DRAFT_133689 [Gonapodya prolifera JEL478]